MKPRFDEGTFSVPSSSADEYAPSPAASLPLQEALSSIAHGINNPLAVIAGNAQLLLEIARAMELDPDMAKPIQDIEEASHQLASMVNSLHDLKDSLGGTAVGGDGQ